VLTFRRAALDLCAEPLVDDAPVHVTLLDEVPPPAAVAGDRIGRQLAQYDPVVRHAQQLSEPLKAESAVFVYDARRGAYVLEDDDDDEEEEEEKAEAGVPDLTSDTSDRSSPPRESCTCAGVTDGDDHSARPRQTSPPTPPQVATPAGVDLVSEGRASLDDALRPPSAARK
jgi:hypothetical protein